MLAPNDQPLYRELMLEVKRRTDVMRVLRQPTVGTWTGPAWPPARFRGEALVSGEHCQDADLAMEGINRLDSVSGTSRSSASTWSTDGRAPQRWGSAPGGSSQPGSEGEDMVDWNKCPQVESVPGKVSGNWVFKGSRLPVYSLFENLSEGATIYDFMEWFAPVDESDVKAVLDFVAQDLRAIVPDAHSPR